MGLGLLNVCSSEGSSSSFTALSQLKLGLSATPLPPLHRQQVYVVHRERLYELAHDNRLGFGDRAGGF